MRRFFCLALFVCALPLASPAKAQEATAQPVEITPSGEAYLRAVRFRRVDTDVVYFDPSAPAPALDTRQQPEAPARDLRAPEGAIETSTYVIAGLLLAAIAYLFLRYGSGMTIALRRATDDARSGRTGPKGEAGTGETALPGLDAIIRIADRRKALMTLSRNALATTVAANGLLLLRSWTARDALRHIPKDQQHRDALGALVMASEQVQFGGRDVSEEEFRSHVTRIRPLLIGATP